MSKNTVTLTAKEAEIVADLLRFIGRKFPLKETTELRQKLAIFHDQRRRTTNNANTVKPNRSTNQ